MSGYGNMKEIFLSANDVVQAGVYVVVNRDEKTGVLEITPYAASRLPATGEVLTKKRFEPLSEKQSFDRMLIYLTGLGAAVGVGGGSRKDARLLDSFRQLQHRINFLCYYTLLCVA